MQVNRINNNINFTGVWKTLRGHELYTTKKDRIDIVGQRTIYHPFKDETDKQIDEAIKAANRIRVRKITDNETGETEKYIILKPVVGDKLNITEKEFNGINEGRDKKGNMLLTKEEYAAYKKFRKKPYLEERPEHALMSDNEYKKLLDLKSEPYCFGEDEELCSVMTPEEIKEDSDLERVSNAFKRAR